MRSLDNPTALVAATRKRFTLTIAGLASVPPRSEEA
jgi:hypothetical protein